ncbi:hypothetical protein RhiJN_26477 [Ceratobasidium sp. AG-Ba]|nr:hypothetical protein RhiJN_26477 [Ceratobasidium sp. AG-Ba]
MSKWPGGDRHRHPIQLLDRLKKAATLAPVAAASTPPLPGLADIKSAVKSICSRLQSSPFERSRCSALAFKMRFISGIIDDMESLELDCTHDISKEILDIERDIDTALASKPSTFRRADYVLEALDRLEKRAESVVNLIQAKLQVRTSIMANYRQAGDIHPSISMWFLTLDQLGVVEAHEITDQVIVPFERHIWYSKYAIESRETVLRGNVTESRRIGRVNGVPVVYTRYSAARASDAEKLAKARLDWHRRCLHLNVASILGVTTGTRLDGVILATGDLTLEEFWRRVDSPRAVAECIKGILTIPSWVLLEPDDRYGRHRLLYMEMAQVDMNGHITSTLTDNPEHQQFLYPPNYWRAGAKYEWVSLALSICTDATYGGGYGWVSNFLDGMARLTPGPTELNTLRLAATTGALPAYKNIWWLEEYSPPVAILSGDVSFIVFMEGQSQSEWLLEPLRLTPEATSSGSNWTTQALPYSPRTMAFIVIDDKTDYQRLSWKARAQFWEQTLSGVPTPNLESLSVCTGISYSIHIRSKGEAIDAIPHPSRRVTALYHHRRPLARSNPRDYWGYLSFSSNPEDRDSDLERNGWILKHDM